MRMCTTAYIIDDDLVEESPEFFEAAININLERVTVDAEITRIQIFDNDREFRGRVIFLTKSLHSCGVKSINTV